MNEKPEQDAIDACLRTLRIIHFALAGGLAAFAGVAVWLSSSGRITPSGETQLLTYVAFAVTAASVFFSFVVPGLLARNVRSAATPPTEGRPPNWAAHPALASYSASAIVGAALLEGPGFFCIIAWLLEGQMIAYVLGVLLIGGIILRTPTEDRLQQHLERHA